MNKVILMGRLTRDPEIRYSSGENQTAIARYTLAVDRRFKRQGDDQSADFINCVVFGRGAEFAEKLSTSGYQDCGNRTYSDRKLYQQGRQPCFIRTDVVVEEQEFCREQSGCSELQRKQGWLPAGSIKT